MVTQQQKANLLELAKRVEARTQPLGVGLKNQCWAGVAISIAKANGAKTTEYYGLSFSRLKEAIKLNNAQRAEVRNSVMAQETRTMAAA